VNTVSVNDQHTRNTALPQFPIAQLAAIVPVQNDV